MLHMSGTHFQVDGKNPWLWVVLIVTHSILVCLVLYHRATCDGSCFLAHLCFLLEQHNFLAFSHAGAVSCDVSKSVAVRTMVVGGEWRQDSREQKKHGEGSWSQFAVLGDDVRLKKTSVDAPPEQNSAIT